MPTDRLERYLAGYRFDMWEPKKFGTAALPLDKARKEYPMQPLYSVYIQGIEQIDPRFVTDQTKQAMVECYKEGLVPLPRYDELCFNVESEQQASRQRLWKRA